MRSLLLRLSRYFETDKKRTQKEISIRKACDLTDQCFEHLLNFICAGMTERKIADEIKDFFEVQHGVPLSFPPIVVSGKRGVLPHGVPSDTKICAGELLILDFGCKVNGYCSDMTRTIAIGEISQKLKSYYNFVLEAQEYAVKSVCAGRPCKEIDKIARNYLASKGLDAYFIHGTGHGVTKKIHAFPFLNKKSTAVLREGDIVTIEPGIYITKSSGMELEFGIRIEDTVLVKQDGYEILTKSTKELYIAG